MELMSYYRKDADSEEIVRFIPDLMDDAPQHKRQIMMWIWIELDKPVTMECKPKFSDSYYVLENLLREHLHMVLDLEYCGSIIQEDGASFYYYGSTARGFDKTVQTLLGESGFESGSMKDKHWEQYIHGLYPDDLNLQLMEDAEIIENLEKSGDNLLCKRDVEYFFYGRNKKDLEKMCVWLGDQGFTNRDGFINEHEKEYHFGMLCVRQQPINFLEMYDTTRGLFEYCDDHGLRYIGWGTKLCD